MGRIASRAIGLLSVIGVIYWATLPPDGIALDESCQPIEMRARISESLHGASFWEAQQVAVEEAIRDEIALRAANERQRDQPDNQRSSIEQKMTRLSDRDISGDEQAVAQAQRKRIERMAWLSRCRQVIKQNLTR
jgi:hypothetical protein